MPEPRKITGPLLALALFGAATLFFIFKNTAKAGDPQADAKARAFDVRAISFEKERESLKAAELAQQEKIKILKTALEEGTVDSLQLLRQDSLKLVAEYRDTILPDLAGAALTAMLSRFTASDWSNWQSARTADSGGPTSARLYVDDVIFANPEIGAELETGAFLLSFMFQATQRGEAFDLEPTLHHLMENAEHFLSGRPEKLAPARYAFNPEISGQRPFLLIFEEQRANCVADYLSAHPESGERLVTLLASVKVERCSEKCFAKLTDMIKTAGVNFTPADRERLLYRDIESQVFKRFTEMDGKFRQAVANLYLMGAVDSIQNSDDTQAGKFLNESVQIYPGMALQKEISGKLEQLSAFKVANMSEEQQEEDRHIREVVNGSDSKIAVVDESNFEISFIGGVAMLVVLVALGIMTGALLRRRSLDSLNLSLRDQPYDLPRSSVRVRDEEDLDIDSILGGEPQFEESPTSKRVGERD